MEFPNVMWNSSYSSPVCAFDRELARVLLGDAASATEFGLEDQ